MAIKIVLAVSLLVNLVFVLRLRPSTPTYASTETLSTNYMHQFIDGFFDQLGQTESCPKESYVCHEGEILAQAVKRMQDHSPFSKGEALHRPDELSVWGLALSQGRGEDYLKTLTSGLERAYFADGLGFGYSLFQGLQKAKERCSKLPEDLNSACLWGIGRELYFVNQDAGEDPRLKGGKTFSKIVMTGEQAPVNTFKTPEERMAAVMASPQSDRRLLSGSTMTCLSGKHMVDCAKDAGI